MKSRILAALAGIWFAFALMSYALAGAGAEMFGCAALALVFGFLSANVEDKK